MTAARDGGRGASAPRGGGWPLFRLSALAARDRLRLRAVAAQRERLHRLRDLDEISDEAFHRLEEEIDWAELDAAPAGFFQPLTTEGAASTRDSD